MPSESCELRGGRQIQNSAQASGVWRGASVACVLLAIGSFSLYMASLVNDFVHPIIYSVNFFVPLALAVGSGFGGWSGRGAAGVKRTGWGVRLKAAPRWLQLAIISTGVIVAVVCIRAGCTALVNPA